MNNDIKWYQSVNVKISFVIVVLLIFALEIIGANFITQLEDQMTQSHKEEQQTQVDFIETSIEPYMRILQDPRENTSSEVDPVEEMNSILNELVGADGNEVTVLNANSVVIATSNPLGQNTVGQISNDSSVRQAILLGEQVEREYVNEDTGDRRWLITSPVRADEESDHVLGVIVLDSNLEAEYTQITEIMFLFINASLLAIVLSIILGNMVSRALTDPIKKMQVRTMEIADGDYSGRLEVESKDEISQLAISINELSEKVSEQQESIDAERRRLDSVLTHMSDGVFATDRRGRIILVNDAALDMLNREREEVMGAPFLEVLDLEDDWTVGSFLKENSEHLIEFEESFYNFKFSLIQGETGYIRGIVCVLHDVTEREQIEQERREFVSNVSHELRTPLTSMRSYLEALNDGAWRDEEIAPHFLQVTQDETDRMIRMINDLLQLSRMDQGREAFEYEIIDLTALFKNVLDRFQMLVNSDEYTDKTYEIVADIDEKTIWIEGDQDRLTQVLDNVLNNAVKYSPEGGQIHTALAEEEGRALISIEDQGLGIPKEDLDRVFSRFYRVDKARTRAQGGTGLGLAISKDVIEQHEGEIWASSTEGRGTTFYISLPCLSDEDVFGEEEWI